MLWWKILLYVFIGGDIILNLMQFGFLLDDGSWDMLPELFNPRVIYAEHNVNYFGCLMVMLFYHVIFSPFAVGYWLYMLGWLFVKLCTIGRR